MLESKSDQGTFLVQMDWTQPKGEGDDVDADNNIFKIRFIEPETGKELEQMTYDFIVFDSTDGRELVHRQSQTATTQALTFSAEGPYTIQIANIDGLGEGAEFDIKVTPEFAPAAFAIVSAAGIAFATVFGAKFRKGL
ncbi:MAG TPA: hypothetical protein VHA09_04260 [Nitrososphaera sp.]|nr:hypothetical protein [Nitrososphaera sp.]